MQGTEKDVNNFIQEFREEFMKLSPEEIAFPRSVNGIGSWGPIVQLFSKKEHLCTVRVLFFTIILFVSKS